MYWIREDMAAVPQNPCHKKEKGVQYISVKYTEAFKFVIIWATLILMDLGHFAEG